MINDNQDAVIKPASRTQQRKRSVFVLVLAATIIVSAIVLPLSSYLYTNIVYASEQTGETNTGKNNPRANYWRSVREGDSGITAASGAYTTNVLIQNGGENWRQIRNGPVATIGGWLLPIALLAIGVFFIFKGQSKIEPGRSRITVPRWSLAERIMHWYTATLFIIMAITGLSLLFGRAVLIPLLGPDGFAAWAGLCKLLHNYAGPFLTIGIVLMIISWMRYNIPNKTDLEWFRKGGGIIGDHHCSAGRMNGGEKAWFWIICTVGLAACISGLILDFPNFEQSRETMQLSSVVHSITAIIWIVVFFGHVYIGTLGTEGALEGMTRGEVDMNWAIQHHDLWYKELRKKGIPYADPVPSSTESSSAEQRA